MAQTKNVSDLRAEVKFSKPLGDFSIPDGDDGPQLGCARHSLPVVATTCDDEKWLNSSLLFSVSGGATDASSSRG